MNKFSYLLMGVLIGLAISYVLHRSEPKAELTKQVQIVNDEDNEYTEKSKSISTIKPVEKVKVVQPLKSSSEPIAERTLASAPNETKKVRKPQHLELSLTEELVKELEKNWSELPRQAQIANEVDGWRVKYIDQHSLFASTGLQEGDFISFQAIRNLKEADHSNENLSERVIRLLNHVQQ